MRRAAFAFALSLAALPALAQNEAFHAGTAIPEYGKIASVESDYPIPKNMKFKVRFNVSEAGEPGEVNRHLETVARFINMHVENGVPLKNIKLAIVVYGPAVADLTKDARYEADAGEGARNANAPLIAALLDKGVRIYVCGQAAAAHNVAKDDLLLGVEMALSAMTANALLDAEGYVLNPF